MRIKAITQGNASVTSMANGAGTLVTTIPANTFVTLTQTKKDGGTTYYYVEDYEGYLKKSYVKLIRDEEFYYSSSLLQSKMNRSSASRLFQAKAELRKLVADDTPSSQSASKNQGTKVTNKRAPSVDSIPRTPGIISSPSATQQKQNQAAVNATTSNKQPVNLGTAAGVAVVGGLLGKTSPTMSRISSSLVSGFMSTGTAKGALTSLGNTSVTSLISGVSSSNSLVGGLLKGATIGNVLDGSFWTSGFLNNVTSVIGGYLRTLLQKLQYVIGFDLYGPLSNWLTGFGITYGNSGWNRNSQTAETKFQYNNDPALEARINKYFQYKGANYKMITRTFAASAVLGNNIDMRWQQDAYYSTGTMDAKQNEEEVEVHKTLYANLYSDFSESLNKAKEGLNLNITRNDWYYNFNRYRLIHPDSLLGNTKGYIFFTRPDLNIGNEISSTDIGALFFNMQSQHPEVIGELTQTTNVNRFLTDHAFMPLLCNRCTGIDIQDEQLETKEINETLTGWKLNYATNLIKSKSANTVMTSFIDDERLSIYLVFKLWCEYISAVSRGITPAKQEYINLRILDYASSIYYFLCGPDGESILFWSKYTGCIPTNIPSSNFSDNYADPIKMPKYSITWQYAFKKDYDPFSLAEFNYLCASGNFRYVPIYSEETARSPVTITGAPYVDTSNAANLFKLKFRPRQY